MEFNRILVELDRIWWNFKDLNGILYVILIELDRIWWNSMRLNGILIEFYGILIELDRIR